MATHFRRCCWVAVAAVVLLGCSNGDDNKVPSEAQAQGDWAQAACSYTARCIEPVMSSCAAGLQMQDESFLDSVNAEFLEAFAACLRGLTCAKDWSTATATCAKQATPSATASSAVVTMCKAKAAAFFDCNWIDADLTSCTQDYAPLADSAAQQLANCVVTTCDDLKTCNQAAFGG